MNSSNHTESYRKQGCIDLHAQNAAAFKPNVFLNGILRLLFRIKGWLAFPSAKKKLPRSTAHSSVSISTLLFNVCLSGKKNVEVKMSMEYWWNKTDKKKCNWVFYSMPPDFQKSTAFLRKFRHFARFSCYEQDVD
jgi:hypothetical protein